MAVVAVLLKTIISLFDQTVIDNKSGFYFTNGEDWFVVVDRHVETTSRSFTRGRESS